MNKPNYTEQFQQSTIMSSEEAEAQEARDLRLIADTNEDFDRVFGPRFVRETPIGLEQFRVRFDSEKMFEITKGLAAAAGRTL